MFASKIQIAVIDKSSFPQAWVENLSSEYNLVFFDNGFSFINEASDKSRFKAIITTGDFASVNGLSLFRTVQYLNVPFIFVSKFYPDIDASRKLMKSGISEVLHLSLSAEDVKRKLSFLINLKRTAKPDTSHQPYRIPTGKRLFDIVFSSLLLLAISPIFLIIAILIKLESKGPIFYISKRVGTGYKVFDFYKFRSMYSDADKRLGQLAGLNQYKSESGTALPPVLKTCSECEAANKSCDSILYLDGSVVCEKLMLSSQMFGEGPTFLKFTNDPRVTRLGKFLRNTSLDELPQILNVFIGDMSFVGNRPLPLYEAEKLTTDRFTTRFVAPAGITGLWQVSKRGGKGPMSHSERIELDNEYARSFSFTGDLKIILKTVPAMFQRENV